jgi:hypothetical protein
MKNLNFFKIALVAAVLCFSFGQASAKMVKVTNNACPGSSITIQYQDCNNHPVFLAGTGTLTYDDALTCGHVVTVVFGDCNCVGTGCFVSFTIAGGAVHPTTAVGPGGHLYSFTYTSCGPTTDCVTIN